MKRRGSSTLRGLKRALRIIASDKSSLFGFIVVMGYILMATVGPFFVPLDLVGRSKPYQSFSLEHPLGTDYMGRDIFAQIVHGAKDVLLIAFVAASFTIVIAVVLGTVAGMAGGRVDAVLTFVTDVMLTIPGFPLLIVIAATVLRGSQNLLILGLALAFTHWATPARSIRAQVLSLKQRDYVEASRCIGFSNLRIMIYDIFPVLMPYIAVNLLLVMLGAVYSLVGLALIGAIPWSEVNWGVMINIAVNYAGSLSYPPALPYLIAPLVAIAFLQIGIITFSHSIEVIFNPRLREL